MPNLRKANISMSYAKSGRVARLRTSDIKLKWKRQAWLLDVETKP